VKQIRIKQIDEYDQDLLIKLDDILRTGTAKEIESPKPVSKERIESLIRSGLKPYILYWENKIAGYALVDIRQNPHIVRELFLTQELMGKAAKSMSYQRLLESLDLETQKSDGENETSTEPFESRYNRLKERSLQLRKASLV